MPGVLLDLSASSALALHTETPLDHAAYTQTRNRKQSARLRMVALDPHPGVAHICHVKHVKVRPTEAHRGDMWRRKLDATIERTVCPKAQYLPGHDLRDPDPSLRIDSGPVRTNAVSASIGKLSRNPNMVTVWVIVANHDDADAAVGVVHAIAGSIEAHGVGDHHAPPQYLNASALTQSIDRAVSFPFIGDRRAGYEPTGMVATAIAQSDPGSWLWDVGDYPAVTSDEIEAVKGSRERADKICGAGKDVTAHRQTS